MDILTQAYRYMNSLIHVLLRNSGHSAVVQGCGRRDITSLFPPSGNEGYISNQDVSS